MTTSRSKMSTSYHATTAETLASLEDAAGVHFRSSMTTIPRLQMRYLSVSLDYSSAWNDHPTVSKTRTVVLAIMYCLSQETSS